MGNFYSSSKEEPQYEEEDSEYESCVEEDYVVGKQQLKQSSKVNCLNGIKQNRSMGQYSVYPNTDMSTEFTLVMEPSMVDDVSSSESELTPSGLATPALSEVEDTFDSSLTSIAASKSIMSQTSSMSPSEEFVSFDGSTIAGSSCMGASGDGVDASLPSKVLSTVDVEVSFVESTALSWDVNFDESKTSKKKTKPPKDLQERLSSKTFVSQRRKEYQKMTVSSPPVMLENIMQRKVLDLRRWYCMSRPQYKKSCGITSLVSVWNYLFSTLGTGNLNPITQEEALHILGFKPPFGEIRFGPFTGNATLMRWFRRLNEFFSVYGKAHYLYKPKGRLQTKKMTDDGALTSLQIGLKSENTGFIYHCLNHYFCPIGYEDTPQNPSEAYEGKRIAAVQEDNCVNPNNFDDAVKYETWVFIGEPSKKHPPMHCKRWTEILQDLHLESPSYYDIRRPEKGVQQRKTKKTGGNLHCIIAFKKTEKRSRKHTSKK
ncbi:basic immunoglobulin-like variable motif-containing protein [Clavelina lepadiformis]|uniref:basic immunoglobulin-like variable motif-containing protein n=1 Tax=Clavelina lepadiformis TaxID=159417 RepID=UPI004041D114